MAATTLQYSQPGIIDRFGTGKNALDKRIDAMRVRFNNIQLQGSRFVRTETAKGGVYTEATYGTALELPRKNQDSDKLPFATPIPGFKASVSIVNYRLAIQVERSYTEDDLHGIVKRQMSGLLNAGRLLEEYLIADFMNNLTSASYAGADGVALASATHPHERRETGTWSNLETSAALSLSSFSTARTNMRKRTDEFGYIMPIFPSLLVVPPELEQKARELKTAELEPDTALNRPNVWKDEKWNWFVYDYYTDTNGWLLWGDMPQEYIGLVMAYGQRPNIASLEGADLSTDIIWGQRLRARMAMMAVDGKNLQINQGA